MTEQKTKHKKQKYLGYPTAIRFRCDDSIVQWVAYLAKEADRTPSAWLRDIIFYLRVSSAGALINARLLNDGIEYRPHRPLEVTADMVNYSWTKPENQG